MEKLALDSDIITLIKGKKIVIGLSGGADSVSLLYLLKDLAEIHAIHVNHMIRGNEAERDMIFCENLCKNLNVRFQSYFVDIPRLCSESGNSLETEARNRRIELFSNYCLKNNIQYVALGHHMNDQAETILFNISRGSHGACGMKKIQKMNNYTILRPLLSIKKSDILSFMKDNNYKWVEDCTNQENDVSRNIIRNIVIPSLNGAVKRDVVPTICRCGSIQQRTDRAISEAFSLLPILDPQGRLFCPFLRDKSEDFVISVISWYFDKNNVYYTESKLQEAYQVFNGEKNIINLKNNIKFKRKEKRCFLVY